jgi:hypothetical protein
MVILWEIRQNIYITFSHQFVLATRPDLVSIRCSASCTLSPHLCPGSPLRPASRWEDALGDCGKGEQNIFECRRKLIMKTRNTKKESTYRRRTWWLTNAGSWRTQLTTVSAKADIANYRWPSCRAGTTPRRVVACRRAGRAVSDRAMGQACGPRHGTWAVWPCPAAHGNDSFAVPCRPIARQHTNTSPFTRIIMKQNLWKWLPNYEKELLCNAAASLKTFLGKTHSCEKP